MARALRQRERKGEYAELVSEVRDLVEGDRRVLTDPYIKEWCGRRYRDLFLHHASRNRKALKAATRKRDDRPERQRIAERFLKRDVQDWKLELPRARIGALDQTTLVFCPGLINGLLPVQAFEDAFPELATRRGFRILRADTHPVRGCEANVEDLSAALDEGRGLRPDCSRIDADVATPPKDVWLLGYSKGTADWLTLLAHRPELKARVRAAVSWAGAVGGSFLADPAYERLRDLRLPLGSLASPGAAGLGALTPVLSLNEGLRRIREYDVKTAVRDLTTAHREAFLAEHGDDLDALDIPFFNVTAATSAKEVPSFQVQGYNEIAITDPDNDMQVSQDQARLRLPMATDLAVFRAHHWDLSYTPFPVGYRMGSPNLDHPFPREAALTALFELLGELGLID